MFNKYIFLYFNCVLNLCVTAYYSSISFIKYSFKYTRLYIFSLLIITYYNSSPYILLQPVAHWRRLFSRRKRDEHEQKTQRESPLASQGETEENNQTVNSAGAHFRAHTHGLKSTLGLSHNSPNNTDEGDVR